MKTTIKIQKTALTATAAVIALVIFSFAVNAQFVMKSLFEDTETNHIALAMGHTNNRFGASTISASNYTGANAYATYLATETEEPLQLEDWMINESSFTTMTLIEAETESPLEIEDWMINESNFDVNSFNFETESENEMILEDWMTNETTFDVFHLFIANETEEELELENWMTNNNLFNVSNLKENVANEKAVTKNKKENNKNAGVFTATNYGRRTLILGTDSDAKLKIETWMFSNKNWK